MIKINNKTYRIAKVYPTLYLCQMVNDKGEDINGLGMRVKELTHYQKCRFGFGTQVISKERVKKSK